GQLLAAHDRQEPAYSTPGLLHDLQMLSELWPVPDEPLQTALEPGQLLDDVRLQGLHREQRNETDQRPDPHVLALAAWKMENMVEHAVRLVPDTHPRAARVVHGVSDLNEVLEELGRDALVRRILPRQLERDGEHVQAEHPHPARTVRLLDVASGWQGSRPIEHADVVEPQEASLEDVHALGVFPIHPPREVQEELVERALEEFSIRPTRPFSIDLV